LYSFIIIGCEIVLELRGMQEGIELNMKFLEEKLVFRLSQEKPLTMVWHVRNG
jgi:hypothetical protein